MPEPQILKMHRPTSGDALEIMDLRTGKVWLALAKGRIRPLVGCENELRTHLAGGGNTAGLSDSPMECDIRIGIYAHAAVESNTELCRVAAAISDAPMSFGRSGFY